MSVREALERIYRDFSDGRPRGLMLTILSILRLRSRGEKASTEAIAREGRRIIQATRGRIDWGVDEGSYTEERVAGLVSELVELGIIEEVEPGEYRIRRDGDDLVDEVYRKVGMIFALRCC